MALYENTQWVPVVLLLGLVACAMPPGLKGELILTLAAFARTPEIAANIWQSLEVAQVSDCCERFIKFMVLNLLQGVSLKGVFPGQEVLKGFGSLISIFLLL